MRWIELDGAVNVRDLGGLPTEDGGTVASNQLLRGDNLQDLSPTDIAHLVESIGVRTVIDLRTRSEVDAEGPPPLTRSTTIIHRRHSLLPEGGAKTDVADALASRHEHVAARYPDDLRCAYYLGYVEDRPDSIVGALRALAGTDGAALVHCAAGKDRTGVVVAVALTVAGVDRHAIIKDYAATAERITAIIERLRSSVTYASDIDRQSSQQHSPRAETMAAFLEQMDTRHGGVHTWLAQHGFTDNEFHRLRTKLRG